MTAASSNGPTGYPDYGLVMRFSVVVDGADRANLGSWASCSGLTVAMNTEEQRSGGVYTHVTHLPKEISYEKITLERAMDKRSSAIVQRWLKQVADTWVGYEGAALPTVGNSVKITLFDSKWSEVASWRLRNAIPVSWEGPSLSAKGSDVATEKLKLAHEGFL